MTDPSALEALASQVEAAPAWAFSMSQQLATLVGGTVRTTDAFDSVFRLRPPGWRFGMGENPVDPRRATVELYQWDGWQPRGCVVSSGGTTLLLALVAATARAHAARARLTGWRASGAVPAVGLHVAIRTPSFGGLQPPGTVLLVTGGSPPDRSASFVLEDGSVTDDGNLCPVALA